MVPKDFFCDKIISGLLPVCYMYISYCGEGVYQIGSANQENLQLSTRVKLFESSFFSLNVLKNGIILVRNPGKFNLK